MWLNDVARERELSHGTAIAAHKAYCLGGLAQWGFTPQKPILNPPHYNFVSTNNSLR